jgi:hypothetical protein
MGKRINIEDSLVIEKYNELKNIYKVAEYFHVSISPIQRILKKNNFELTNRRYEVDEEYFDIIDTEEKAYWLGFLYADGYIRERKHGNSLELKLSIKDKNHLELFKKCISSTHRIVTSFNSVKYKNGISKSEMCHIALYSTKLVQSIKTKGIHERKTFTIGKPNIDTRLMRHFIRGYFDGDGSFSFNPDNYSVKTQIVSASDDFKKFIINELDDNGIKINLYSNIKLQIQSKMDNKKFYDYIYSGSKIYLKRKKDKYEKFTRYYGYDN